MKMNYLLKSWAIALSTVLFAAGCSSGTEDNNRGNSVTVTGAVQKGPFIEGAAITVQALKSDLNPTGSNLNTQITNDFGSFSVTGEIASGYAEIIAKGYYFNEVLGNLSSGEITLRSLSQINSSGTININILTTLQVPRVRKLVSEGKSFGDAVKQSQTEVLEAFEIEYVNCPPFEEMNIAKQGEGNAILLAISAIVQVGRTEAQLSEFIAKVANDIADNGILDQSTIKDEIINSALSVDPDAVRENLIMRYGTLGQVNVAVPNFSAYIDDYRYNYLDSDGNGILDKDETEWRFNLHLGYATPSSTRASAETGSTNVPDALKNVNDITMIGFDKSGQAIFVQRDNNPVLNASRTYNFSITPRSGEKVFEKAKIYVLVNCPNDYSSFSNTETSFKEANIAIDFNSLKEDRMIMIGVISSTTLKTWNLMIFG